MVNNKPYPTNDESALVGLRTHGLRRTLECWMLFFVFTLLRWTYKVRVEGLEHRRLLEASKNNFSFAFWHKNIFASMATHPYEKISPMISPSRDGELIAFIAVKVGHKPIRGSKGKDGVSATQELAKMSKKGWHAAFAVDGPKGPALKVKAGVIATARDAEVAILPLSVAADRCYILKKTWDHTKIPKAFSTLTVKYGPPVFVDMQTHGLRFAEKKRELQKSLEALEKGI